MAELFDPHFQAVDDNGLPLSGALLFFYEAQTTTLVATYQDAGATTPHTNPVLADAAGMFPPIYLGLGSYKIVLQTALGVTVQTVDDISTEASPGSVGTDALVDGSITEPKLADGSVSTRALADGSVTNPKVADDAINARTIDGGDSQNIRAVLDVNRNGKDGVFITPPEFSHRAGTLAYKYQNGRGELITDLGRLLPPGWTVRTPSGLPPTLTAYFVKRSGSPSDSNSGADWANALATISAAAAKSDVDVIFVEGGSIYTLLEGLGTYTGSRNIAIIAVGRPAIMSPQRETTWSADTEPNTFISGALGGTPAAVMDARFVDEFGAYTRLTHVASKALVSANPGSFCINGSGAGATVTVRLNPGATPTNSTVWVYRGFDHRFSGSGAMYLYNFIFPEGFSARNTGSTSSVIALENCTISNHVDSNGLQWLDVGIAIMSRCRMAGNFADGIDYSAFNGFTAHGIEIDCVSAENYASGTSNGSTAHSDAVVFRLNTGAFNNAGPGIADVDNSKSYNVGISSNRNGATSGSSNAYGIYADGTVEMWLHGCVANENAGQPDILAKGSAVVHYLDCYPVPVAQESATVAPF